MSVDLAVDFAGRSFAVDPVSELTDLVGSPESAGSAVAQRFFEADLPAATLALADSQEPADSVVERCSLAVGSPVRAEVDSAE